jgi:CheY-like chemotaxis protein
MAELRNMNDVYRAFFGDPAQAIDWILCKVLECGRFSHTAAYPRRPMEFPTPQGYGTVVVLLQSAERFSVFLLDSQCHILARWVIERGQVYNSYFDQDARPVLVVIDDEQEILYQLEDILGSKFKVHAFTVAPARSLLTALRPDVILLDLLLPEESGRSILADIRDEKKWRTPVVILTGYPDRQRQLDESDLEYSVFLQKQASLSEIEEAIDSCLGLRHT